MVLNRQQLIYLWVGLGFLMAAFVWDMLFSGERNAGRYKAAIEAYLHPLEKDVNDVLADKSFITRRLNGQLAASQADITKLDILQKKPFNICLYVADSLVFWTRNDVLPSGFNPSDTELNKMYIRFVEINSSQYELRYRHALNEKNQRVTGAALIPIKKDYGTFEGQYLNNHFPASPLIPDNVQLADKGSHPILTFDNVTLSYLDATHAKADAVHDWGMVILLTIGFFILGWVGNRIAKQMLRQYSTPLAGTVFFIATLLLLRLCIIAIEQADFLPFIGFKFGEVSSPIFVKSLSALFVNMVFLFWLAVFFSSEFKMPDFTLLPFWKRWVLSAACYTLIVMLLILCIGIFDDLVTKWNNVLTFDNLSDFSLSSVAALASVSMILLAIFLISHRLIGAINELKISLMAHFFAVDLAIAIGIFFFTRYGLNLPVWMYVFFIFLYIALFQQFIRFPRPGIIWLMQWVIVFAAIQAFFISRFNSIKDYSTLERYAFNLAQERDTIAEEWIKHLTKQVESDSFIQVLSYYPIRDPNKIYQAVKKHYQSDEYLSSQYHFRTFGYSNSAVEVFFSDSLFNYSNLMSRFENAKSIQKNHRIRFWSNSKGNMAYLAIAEIPSTGGNNLSIAMEFTREDKLSSRIFTELLVDKYFKKIDRLNEYNYAIYKGSECKEQNQKGYYDNFINASDIPEKGKFLQNKLDDKDEVVYQSEDGIVVRISKARAMSSQGFTLWMYIVVVMIILIFLLSAINHFIRFLPHVVSFTLSFSFNTSMRSRILIPVIGFILFSYIVIFVVSIRYFKDMDERYYYTSMESISSNVVSNVIRDIYDIRKYPDYDKDNKEISSRLEKYAVNFQNAIHFYNTDGVLQATTEANIFSQSVMSNRINPVAFLTLRSGTEKVYKSDEYIGKFHYKSTYYAVQDSNNLQRLGFLHIPFYGSDRRMKHGFSDTWGHYLTVMTLLFLLSVCLLYYQTERNIKPISTVADRVRKLSLGGDNKNELIPWDKKDEIGVLIDAYNNKVSELEDTYSQLSEIEREGAWRDMAKQVAHEIRNPLTPMKLVVQHLEMMRKQHPENIEDYLIRANKVLLDQIDNLEKIVLEFANFAKMPQKATSEKFILNEVVASVAELFSQRPNDGKVIDFSLSIPDDNLVVFADRALLIGALNNLVKNAIQAIPENREGLIDVALYNQDMTAFIKISDNGVGIPKEIQHKIFSPNFTTKSYGSGIGLLITKNIIQSFNGRITFDSEENIGTDFLIELDIVDIERPHKSTSPNHPTIPLS